MASHRLPSIYTTSVDSTFSHTFGFDLFHQMRERYLIKCGSRHFRRSQSQQSMYLKASW